MGDLCVGTLADGALPDWDRFVEAAPNATFFHRAGLKTVIEKSFGHRCHYHYVTRGGEITGILPLVQVKSRLFGNALISVAFGVTGGPICRDPESDAALDDVARTLARELAVDYVEYRLPQASGRDWPAQRHLYAAFRKTLLPDSEANFRAIPRKRRAELRKAMARELTIDVDNTIDNFFPVYAESVRNLGTPVYARRYYENLLNVFGKDCQILTVRDKGRPVCSLMSFFFKDAVLPYYGGGTREARDLAAYDLMYWDLMCRSVEKGVLTFDFGRSKFGTGAFAYKTHWGFEPEPMSYEYLLLRRTNLPDDNPTNPKYRFLIGLWRLLPLPLANVLGPLISRGIG